MLFKSHQNFLFLAIKNNFYVFDHVKNQAVTSYTKNAEKATESDQKKPMVSTLDSPDIVEFAIYQKSDKILLIGLVYNDKICQVFQLKESEKSLELVTSYSLPKRPTNLCFDSYFQESEEKDRSELDHYLLICDKAGDVYRRSYSQNKTYKNSDNAILGTISMLLDVNCTQKYILTADRDEKVRISPRLRAYDIEGFLLGHTEGIYSCLIVDENTCLTFSNDKFLKIWNLEKKSSVVEEKFENSCKLVQNSAREFSLIFADGSYKVLAFRENQLEQIGSGNLEFTVPVNSSSTVTLEALNQAFDIQIQPDFYKSYISEEINKNVDRIDSYPEKYRKMYLDPGHQDLSSKA